MNQDIGAGSTAKVYVDSCGDERTLQQMIKLEPEWAHNRIVAGEIAIQELDAARLEVERLRGALTDIRDCNGWIGTNHKYMKLLASEALAAQQEAG